MEEACGEAHFYELGLDPRTALMASGCEAVNVFVNDDCGAETLNVLKDVGVQMVTLRWAFSSFFPSPCVPEG
jgi:D-lactate dehydrogenase